MSDCPPLTGESEQGALLSRPLDGPVPSLFGKQVPLQTRGKGLCLSLRHVVQSDRAFLSHGPLEPHPALLA